MEERLLSIKEALEYVLDDIKPVETEIIPIETACGMILAEDIKADINLPRFTNSSMDGFAIRAADIRSASSDSPTELSIIADIPAGTNFDGVIDQSQAARVMTGGILPKGADSVVPVEYTNFDYRSPGVPAPANVLVYQAINKGDYVRISGDDLKKGQLILSNGCNLRSQDIGMLATLGKIKVKVYKKPKIGILSTGDEIVELGDELQIGKIFDSNSYMLSSMVHKLSAEAIRLGIAKDETSEIKRCLDQAITHKVDLIVSSAGVSVGAFDYVKSVIEEFGHINFWRVNMRPGKPLAFGDYRGIPFVGLPGNPVSAFVGFTVFVYPMIMRLRGSGEWKRQVQKVILDEAITSDGRESYLRSIVFEKRGKLYARLAGNQGSGNLYSLVQANALLIVPSEVKSLPVGVELDAWVFSTAC